MSPATQTSGAAAAEERQAFGDVLAILSAAIADHAEAARARSAATPEFERMVELRYSLLAVVQAAVECGLRPGLALATLRDLGPHAWGTKLLVQYAGAPAVDTVADAARDLAGLLIAAAGHEAEITCITPADLESAVRH